MTWYHFALHVWSKAALLQRLSWTAGGCPIPWKVWKELCWAGSTQEEHSPTPKQRNKSNKRAIFNFEKKDYLWYLQSHKLFKKQTSPESATLWATNWSASLQQAYLIDLNDFCSCCAPGPALIPSHLELDAMKVSVRWRVCWSVHYTLENIVGKSVSTNDFMLNWSTVSWEWFFSKSSTWFSPPRAQLTAPGGFCPAFTTNNCC